MEPAAAAAPTGIVPRPGALIVIVKLFLSAATACLALGYAARHRANAAHRPLMALGTAIAWTGGGIALLGTAGLGLPLRPAYWLVESFGSGRTLAAFAAVHQAFAVLALLVLAAQVVLGRLRHPLHRPVSWVALPLWVLVWATAMFGYV